MPVGEESEFAEQTYYPSAKVKLAVRFDTFGEKDKSADKTPASKKPNPKNAKGINAPDAVLSYQDDPERPEGSNRVVLVSKAPGAPPASGLIGPQKQAKSSDGMTHYLEGIIPHEAQWGQNGLRVADTLKLQIRYIDLPIDPRVVKSCAVEFYCGTVSADEYARGIAGEHRFDSTGMMTAALMNLIPDEYIDAKGRTRTNLRFQGFVDKWETEFTESGEPMLHLDCRDNTQLLIDVEVPPALLVDMKLPIHLAVANYLTHFPHFEGLSVEYRPNDERFFPTLKDWMGPTAFRPKIQGVGPSKGGGAENGKHAVWDFLTDIVGSVGHTIRIEGTVIIIQQARTYYSNRANNNRPDDPFTGRLGFNNRLFIYGRNILEMKINRSFAKTVPKNIEVRCASPRTKQTFVGRFPEKEDRIAAGLPGDAKEQQWSVHKVTGISSEKLLRIIARNIYEMLGRNELGVQITTKNLASFGGGNADPDILDMKPGDAIELGIDRNDIDASTITKMEKYLVVQGSAQTWLQNLGFPEDFAKAYGKAYAASGFQSIFKTKSVSMTWNVDEGVKFDIVGMNYVEVDGDALLPDEKPTPVADAELRSIENLLSGPKTS